MITSFLEAAGRPLSAVSSASLILGLAFAGRSASAVWRTLVELLVASLRRRSV